MAHPLSRSLRNLFREIRALLVENTLDPLPIRKALGGYDGERLAHDLRAGLNVALLALPQGMAYAAIAELPIVYGIACSAIAAVVAPFFAGSRHTILGPTNATAFMIFSLSVPASLGMQKAELLPLLCLMVGAFSVLGALLKVADLLQYISRSVLVGYISGAAVLIIANQLKHILGIAPQIDAAVTADADGQAPTFLGIVGKIADHLPEGQWQTVTLSAATLGVYLLLQRRFRLLPTFAITLVLFAAVAAALRAWVPGFEGLERFEAFTLEDLQPRLPDVSRTPLFEQISFLAGIAFAVAFLASLENTVMAKSLASRTNDRPDVNQDMYAVGMSNVVAGVFAGMPASGSLTRSQLNYDSGARTRFASLFCGLICLAGTFLLAVVPLVSHVPKACLAALVVGIAASLISPRLTRICLRSTGDDAAVLIVTFLAALAAPLHVAIFIGVAFSITLFLRKASRPHLVEYEVSEGGDLRELGEKRARPNPAISIVHVEGDLFFGAADLFRTQIQRTVVDENLRVIILRLKNARHLDATSVMALEDLIRYTRSQGRHIIVSGATRDVYRVLKASGVLETLQEGADRSQGESNLFLYRPSNPNISTRDALKRAQQLLGTTEADIKIFYDPNQDK